MWVRHNLRNLSPPYSGFLLPVGSLPSSLCNRSFRATRILSTVGVDIPADYSFRSNKTMSTVGVDIRVDHSFQRQQNPDNF